MTESSLSTDALNLNSDQRLLLPANFPPWLEVSLDTFSQFVPLWASAGDLVCQVVKLKSNWSHKSQFTLRSSLDTFFLFLFEENK